MVHETSGHPTPGPRSTGASATGSSTSEVTPGVRSVSTPVSTPGAEAPGAEAPGRAPTGAHAAGGWSAEGPPAEGPSASGRFTGGGGYSGAGNAIDRLVERCRATGVVRRQDRRWVAGVCVGLADRWGVDPVLLRVGFILLTVFGGVGVALYLWGWLLLPAADGRVALERALRGLDGAAVTLLVLTALVTLGSLVPEGGGGIPPAFTAILVVGGVWWLLHRGSLPRRRDTAALPVVPAPATTTSPLGTAGDASATWSDTRGPDAGAAASAAPDMRDAGTGTTSATMPAATFARRPAATFATGASAAGTSPSPEETRGPGAAAWPSPIQDVVPSPAGAPAWERTASGWGTPPWPAAPVPPTEAVAADPRRRRTDLLLGLVVAGLSLLAYLAGGSVAAAVHADRPWIVALAAPLAVMGVSLVASAFTRHRPTLLVTATLATAFSLLLSLGAGSGGDAGDVRWAPTSVADLRTEYTQGVGDAELDLTAVPVDGVRHVRLSQGVGDLVVRLPAGVSARVVTGDGVGEVTAEREDGDVSRVTRGHGEVVTAGAGPLAYEIELRGGVGDVDVRISDEPARTPTGTGPSLGSRTATGAPGASSSPGTDDGRSTITGGAGTPTPAGAKETTP